jgi:hypothetical protein
MKIESLLQLKYNSFYKRVLLRQMIHLGPSRRDTEW